MSTTNVSLFWSNPQEEESPLPLSGSIPPVDSHSSSSKEVTWSQSGPLQLLPPQGGIEFKVVHWGLRYTGLNSEGGGGQKRKTQVG